MSSIIPIISTSSGARAGNSASASGVLFDYYRYSEQDAEFSISCRPSSDQGFFRFGQAGTCYGGCSSGPLASTPSGELHDCYPFVAIDAGTVQLPFDAGAVILNLRREIYAQAVRPHRKKFTELLRRIYYIIRPLLNVNIRKRLQKLHLDGWSDLPFPHWPVDSSVDSIMESALYLCMRACGIERLPFLWFWPDGASSTAIMTHDVETEAGRDFCRELMDLDDQFGVKASFQIVPEKRYEVPPEYLSEIRDRGFEINVQDLNHDGHLFRERGEFLRRAAKINEYGRKYRAGGFRSAVLYRNQDWFNALDFEYDMSVPNVAHLEPQRGGCCTVMPYFIGRMLEIPVTTTQDYSLFHILNDYSIQLWKQQIELIGRKHGLVSFIVHPDYIIDRRARGTYLELLDYLVRLRADRHVWIPLPREVNQWWRDRQQSRLVRDGDRWTIEGPAKERGRIAYAHVESDHLVYTLDQPSNG